MGQKTARHKNASFNARDIVENDRDYTLTTNEKLLMTLCTTFFHNKRLSLLF